MAYFKIKRYRRQFTLGYPFSSVLLAAVLGSLIGVGIFVGVGKFGGNNLIQTNGSSPQLDKQIAISAESAVTDVVKNASPAVVSVLDQDAINSSQRGAIGTGFVVSPNGYIVTAAHVVSDTSTKYYVVTQSNDVYPIDKILKDTKNDVALLSITAVGLPTIPLGNSDSLVAGQEVIAIGTILGRLENSVTVGVVSALGRQITAGDPGSASETLNNVIQVDVPLNPGNSGGPLLNLSGEVVGINFAVTQGAQDVGFAVPINFAKNGVISAQVTKTI